MEKNKYIEVIDYYNRLLKKRTINRETALWTTHAIMLCVMKDDRTTADDYYYLLGYRDELFKLLENG